MTVIGEVAGKDVVIIDDMCDTAGTLTTAANLLVEKGQIVLGHLHTRRA